MGNPVQEHCIVEKMIKKLKQYKNAVEEDLSDNTDKMFRAKEILKKIIELSNNLDRFLECHDTGDYSMNEEERMLYLRRLAMFTLCI
jgi:hypothetical protein